MEDANKIPSRWETKKLRTPRLSREQLDEKLNMSRKNETDDEDNAGAEGNDPTVQKTVTSRSSAKRVAQVVSKFCMLKRRLVTEIGFPGILQISQINKTDRLFTLEILKLVNCREHKIKWGNNCEIDITHQSMQRVLGIPCGSEKVCGMEDDTAEEKLDFIRICIGTGRDEEDEIEDAKEYDSLAAAEFNVTREYPNGMTRTEEEQFKVSFCVFLVCRFLFPIAQPNSGSKIFWGALLDSAKIHTYNWCGLVVENIIESARKVQYTLEAKGQVAYVGGCSLALQVLFLDYLRFGCCNKLGVRLPRISDYSCSSMSKLINCHRMSNTQAEPLMIAQETNMDRPVEAIHQLAQSGAVNNKDNLIGPTDLMPTKFGTAIPTVPSINNTGEVTHTVASYNQAVTNTKLPMRQKLALRYFMARIVTHSNTFKNAMIAEGVKLANKLDEATNNQHPETNSIPSILTTPLNPSIHGGSSVSHEATEVLCARAPSSTPRRSSSLDLARRQDGPVDPDDPFCLGIDWETNGNYPDKLLTIPMPTHDLRRPFIPTCTEVKNKAISMDDVQPVNKGYNSDPETSRSNKMTPCSNKTPKPSFLWNNPNSLYVGDTKKSPAVINRNWSESALLVRVFEDDENAKIAGKRLSFEFTDTPVKKRVCTYGRIAKSPWGQRLAHPARNQMLISSFAEWLLATTSNDLERFWIQHSSPRFIALTGHELKQLLLPEEDLSYNLFDLGVRRLLQLDSEMFSKAGAQVWRTIMESDFAMLVLAECSHTNNISIRAQFVGSQVNHEIKNSRMIAVPALVRENWCSYFWDAKLKLVHVVDPLFNPNSPDAFKEIHNPNISKIGEALTISVKEFFESWSPDWADWKINYVSPMLPKAKRSLSGILTLISLRDFNGANFSNEQNKHVLHDFTNLLLHELLSMKGNEAAPPQNFVQASDGV